MYSHSRQVASLEQAQTNLRLGILNLDMLRQLRQTPASQKVRLKRTFGQLKKALEDGNAKYVFPQSQISRCCNEMAKIGVDIEQLEAEIAVRKAQRCKEQETKKEVQDCYFYIPKLSLSNITQCLDKALEYNVFNSIQQTMMITDFPRQLRRQFLKRRRGLASDTSIRNTTTFVSNLRATIPIRNELTQKNDYIAGGCKNSPVQLAREFLRQTNNMVWAVLVRQFEKLDTSKMSKMEIVRAVLKSSVQMIEEENSRALPNEAYAVESHVKSQILARPEIKKNPIYYEPRNNRPIWAIIYTLLKAGRHDDILRIDDKPLFTQDFRNYLYDSRRQRYVWRGERNQIDLFTDMIYAVFNRTPMGQECLLTVTKDLLWFGLKTSDLESEDPAEGAFTVEELQKLIIDRHEREMTADSLVNLVYCMAYDEVLRQVSDQIDIDDSMHLFIVLSLMRFPQRGFLMKTREEFINALAIYAQDLASLGLENCINYFLLAYDPTHPETKRDVFHLVERFITQRNVVQQFFGSFPKPDTRCQLQLQKLMGPCKQQFSKMIDQVAELYKKKYMRYVYPALLYHNLLNDAQKSLDCIITMRLEALIEDRVVDEAEKRDAAKLVDKYVKEKKYTKEQEVLLNFMNSYVSLCGALDNRSRLSYELSHNPCVPRTENIDTETLRILNALNSRGAIKLYLMFFEMVVRAIEIECTYKPDRQFYKSKISQLQSFSSKITKNSVVESNAQALRGWLSKIHDLLSKPAIRM